MLVSMSKHILKLLIAMLLLATLFGLGYAIASNTLQLGGRAGWTHALHDAGAYTVAFFVIGFVVLLLQLFYIIITRR